MNEIFIFVWVIGWLFGFGTIGPEVARYCKKEKVSLGSSIALRLLAFFLLIAFWPVRLGALLGRVAVHHKYGNPNVD